MNTRLLTIAACTAAAGLIGACASDNRGYATAPSPAPVYSTAPQYANPQYSNQYAQFGQVNRIDVIPAASRTSGGGAVLGAVLGAVVGNQFGAGTGRALATGAGAVGGAVAGNAIERRTRRDDEVFRVGVRFEDGSYREYDFQRIDDLQVGDRVKFEGGQLHRL
jgi:outer membrane lipoprotein SlyB